MPYKIQSSEKLRSYGSENETKALFYLMGEHADSKDIYYFIVDIFNDLTGMTKHADKMWDLQSKGDKSPSPKTIGKELVTLFKNYTSSFQFKDYIIFLGGVSPTLRLDDSKNVFGIDNIKSGALSKVKEGLKEESQSKIYIEKSKITNENINSFLEKVLFVVVSGEKEDYVNKIIKLSDKVILKPEVLRSIFNEVRNMQDSKKNICDLEGKIINSPEEALGFGRHLNSNEIRLMAINRILNQEVINQRPPLAFLDIYNSYPEESRRYMLEDCQHCLSRALFNVNEQEEFWRLLDSIYTLILESPFENVDKIYMKMDKEILKACTDFDVLATKYFIAVIKDGVINDN